MAEPLRNALAGELSPYLLEHARDPVAWQPWGEAALARARAEEKPIFLSIGYSACHWCHVMQRETFADERAAAVLNEHFVCIKVDREERPDLDELYVTAVQSMTGSAGWPLSVFLTPDGAPFHGGTYFPPVAALGLPGFVALASELARAWRDDRARLLERARRVREGLARDAAHGASGPLAADVLDRSLTALAQRFDPLWGGFGDAPKFPRATDLRLCLRHHLRMASELPLTIARVTLDRMARGAIHDQLGGGFHRYATDERWLVPHYEKMLCDNALLATAYLEAHLVTGEREPARVARSTIEWALREMRTSEGAFATAQDADSAGEEGAFYTWTARELRDALGAERAAWASEWWRIADADGERGALWREQPASEAARRLRVDEATLARAMDDARATLLRARERRPRPATDDKVLAGWNGLMASALALGAQVLDESGWADAAARAMRHVLGRMSAPDGRLLACARGGEARHPGSLADHAYVVQALIDLYETDFDAAWIRAALELAAHVSAHFSDAERGGWRETADDHEPLLARLARPEDRALPSGAGVHVTSLLRLAELTGRAELAREAERALLAHGAAISAHPIAFGQHVLALDFLAAPPREVALAGDPAAPELAAMLRAVRASPRLQRVVALRRAGAPAEPIGLLEGRDATARAARAWVCSHWSCRAPVDDAASLARELHGDLDARSAHGGDAGDARAHDAPPGAGARGR